MNTLNSTQNKICLNNAVNWINKYGYMIPPASMVSLGAMATFTTMKNPVHTLETLTIFMLGIVTALIGIMWLDIRSSIRELKQK